MLREADLDDVPVERPEPELVFLEVPVLFLPVPVVLRVLPVAINLLFLLKFIFLLRRCYSYYSRFLRTAFAKSRASRAFHLLRKCILLIGRRFLLYIKVVIIRNAEVKIVFRISVNVCVFFQDFF